MKNVKVLRIVEGDFLQVVTLKKFVIFYYLSQLLLALCHPAEFIEGYKIQCIYAGSV